MNRSDRKPPKKVHSIDGKQAHEQDVITQAELRKGSELQLTVWHAEKLCRDYINGLCRRYDEGARIENGQFTWDSSNEMVRSRKKEDVG